VGDNVFRRRDEIRERLRRIIEKFHQKGAISPETALAPEDLDLPQEFQKMMKRRLGSTGIFVKVGGKYYLSEERLKEVKDEIASRRRRW
jgi:hypothetical protein